VGYIDDISVLNSDIMAKKNKYDITVQTDLSFEELVKAVVSAPKEAVNKAIKSEKPLKVKKTAKK